MTDRDVLLRAVVENPAGDTPRLVYADWLDENGFPVPAELIRLHVELDPIRDRLDDPRVRELIRRLDHLRPEWDRTDDEDDPRVHWAVGLRRGLPGWAECDVRTLVDRGADCRAEYPTVRELAVFAPDHDIRRLAGCSALADLDTLELPAAVSPGDAATLAEGPHLAGVGTLRLWIGWSEALAEAVAVARPQPARIELVQLLGGVTAGDRAADLDAEADAFAARVNALAGRNLCHVIRPFDRAFPLCGRDADDRPGIDIGGGMFAGQLPDGTPTLIGTNYYGQVWSVVRFLPDGRLAGIEDVSNLSPDGMWIDAARLRWASDEIGLRPAIVRVREFSRYYDCYAGLWPRSYIRPGDVNWQEHEANLYRWLKGGCFDIGRYTADWRGRLGQPTFED